MSHMSSKGNVLTAILEGKFTGHTYLQNEQLWEFSVSTCYSVG
jgi:hypothetical protein